MSTDRTYRVGDRPADYQVGDAYAWTWDTDCSDVDPSGEHLCRRRPGHAGAHLDVVTELVTDVWSNPAPCKHGGMLRRKFDGGRGTMLCERCDHVVGYYTPPAPQPIPAATGDDRALREAEAAISDLIDERDHITEIADRLAYAIAPVEVIGEHSSANDPWTNAIEIAEQPSWTPVVVTDAMAEAAAQTIAKWRFDTPMSRVTAEDVATCAPMARAALTAALAAAPRVVFTAEDLDELPAWSVVIDRFVGVWQLNDDGWWRSTSPSVVSSLYLAHSGPLTVVHVPSPQLATGGETDD